MLERSGRFVRHSGRFLTVTLKQINSRQTPRSKYHLIKCIFRDFVHSDLVLIQQPLCTFTECRVAWPAGVPFRLDQLEPIGPPRPALGPRMSRSQDPTALKLPVVIDASNVSMSASRLMSAVLVAAAASCPLPVGLPSASVKM